MYREAFPLVSIIVPVYNVEKYLNQCILSIQQQSLKEIEIIIIDDGSTDDSCSLCDGFLSDQRVHVVHKKVNTGLSMARNIGTNLASAKYIMFVDGDDWVEPLFCELPYCAAEKHQADIVCFQHFDIKKNGKVKKSGQYNIEGIVTTRDKRLWEETGVASWNKLYRKSLFTNIHFPEDHVSEDIATTHRLIYNASKIILMNEYLYNYRTVRDGSISNSPTMRMIEDYVIAKSQRIQDLIDWGIEDESARARVALSILAEVGQNIRGTGWCIEYLKRLDAFPSDSDLKCKIMYKVYSKSPSLFDAICKIVGKRKRIGKL